MGLRETLNNSPWLRWVVPAILLAAAVLFFIRGRTSSNPYSFDQLAETVTLVCRETGEEFKMPRGQVERELWGRPLPLDLSQGLLNPGTGRPTLFPKSEWEQTVERINSDRQAIAAQRSRPRNEPED